MKYSIVASSFLFSFLFVAPAFGALSVTVTNDPIDPANQSSTAYTITKDLTYVFLFLFNPDGNSYGDMVDPAVNTTTATLPSFNYGNAIVLQEGVNTVIALQSNSVNNAASWNPYCGSGKTITDCEVASTAEDDFLVESPAPSSSPSTTVDIAVNYADFFVDIVGLAIVVWMLLFKRI